MSAGSTPIRIGFEFTRHSSADRLPPSDQQVLQEAIIAADRAYAPYSGFHVGAALRSKDGSVRSGNNQENAAFPAGICAERNCLHTTLAQDPKAIVEVMAIAAKKLGEDQPVSPCGVCRQVLLEQQVRQGSPIRLLLAGADGSVIEVPDVSSLLPLAFTPEHL